MINEKSKTYDAIVLGKGPIGLFTSNYLVEKKMNILNIDAGHGLNEIKNNIEINSNINYRGVDHMPSLNWSATEYAWTGACMGWPREDINNIPIHENDLEKSEKYISSFLEIENFDFSKNLPSVLPDQHTENIRYASIVSDMYLNKINFSLFEKKGYNFIDNLMVEKIIHADKDQVEIKCMSYPEKKTYLFKTKKLFICLGGIQNTKLLLASDNLELERKHLGMHLSDHLSFPMSKLFTLNHIKTKDKYDYIYSKGTSKIWPRVINKEFIKDNHRLFTYFTEHKKRFRKLSILNIGTLKLNVFLEKKEDSTSNIKYDDEKLIINFNLTIEEENLIENLLKEIKKNLKKSDSFFTYHPSGTTRMSFKKSEGVVNLFSTLWSHENIFVFGSSNFPRATYIHPTFPALSFAHFSLDNL